MNPSHAYEQIRRDALDGRQLEASVLARAARKLNRCAQNWDRRDTPAFREELQEALAFTQRLWTFLQLEMNNSETALPAPLRTSIFRLSRYVDKTALALYSGGSLQELKSLANINKDLAAGLSGGE